MTCLLSVLESKQHVRLFSLIGQEIVQSLSFCTFFPLIQQHHHVYLTLLQQYMYLYGNATLKDKHASSICMLSNESHDQTALFY